jgi:hypothetical protein
MEDFIIIDTARAAIRPPGHRPTTWPYHGPVRMFCGECMEFWALAPAPDPDDCPYCWAARDAQLEAGHRTDAHEDHSLCPTCRRGFSAEYLADLGYTEAYTATLTPLLERVPV